MALKTKGLDVMPWSIHIDGEEMSERIEVSSRRRGTKSEIESC